MPSRMEKYYKSNNTKSRTTKNQDLYKSIYEEAEYSNVEGITIIEKDEKIDLNKIYELIQNSKKEEVIKEYVPKKYEEPEIIEEDKNYDILDILNKAKIERTDKEVSNTQYNVLKNIDLKNSYKAPNLDDDELKVMIEAISTNSKNEYTTDLLDDLKTIHDNSLIEELDLTDNEVEKETPITNIDKSFYTSSLSFTDDDFEEIKDSIKKNNYLTKILIFILSVIIVTGLMFIIYFLIK